eukprot:gb/GFBE01015061.1/.p1 GENE.gb/GFBE01015061.1/~~gb/GFBE01015061.1/.p1  ORF type:complete len:411 (+),score=55.89 gb/GFBE01015061.1/:1-1233(+)
MQMGEGTIVRQRSNSFDEEIEGEWWPPPLSEQDVAIRQRAARLLEALRRIPLVYYDIKAWENEHENAFCLFRKGCLDGANNGMLEAPIFNNRQIEDAWLFLLEMRRRHFNRRKHIQECARILGASYNWSMVLAGSRKVHEALRDLPDELRLEILEDAQAFDLLASMSSPSRHVRSEFEQAPSWSSHASRAETNGGVDGSWHGTDFREQGFSQSFPSQNWSQTAPWHGQGQRHGIDQAMPSANVADAGDGWPNAGSAEGWTDRKRPQAESRAARRNPFVSPDVSADWAGDRSQLQAAQGGFASGFGMSASNPSASTSAPWLENEQPPPLQNGLARPASGRPETNPFRREGAQAKSGNPFKAVAAQRGASQNGSPSGHRGPESFGEGEAWASGAPYAAAGFSEWAPRGQAVS